MLRRTFLQTLSATAFSSLAAGADSGIRLGLDAYSVRDFEWKAMELLDFARGLGLGSIQMSAPGEFESLEPAHLDRVRMRASEYDILMDVAISSICPTTGAWDREETPQDYIAMGLRVAQAVGSRTLRCFVGGPNSRGGDPPFEAHVESTLKVLRSVRSRVLDSGIKLAIENHGDFEARELRSLIEEAGPDVVGCCLDTGNPMSVMEDPLLTLEVLGPHTVSSHIRDSVVYEHPRGAAFQWVALGDGSIDFKQWTARYRQLCPNVPLQLEILTGSPPTVLPFLEDAFWKKFPNKPAADFSRFLRLVKDGHPFNGSMMIAGRGQQPPEYQAALRQQQRVDVERSVAYAKEELKV
jgi:sugar phosphate isomerase/epimerase